MSHYMTALAMRQTGLKPATKIVLYWLADHHNETTGDCFPSIARLADLCEMSRRAVEGHLADLEAAGLIERHARHRETGGKTSNAYTLRLVGTDAQNLRIPPAKSAHGDAQNLRIINLVSNNHGKEQDALIDGVCVFDVFNDIAKDAGWPTVQARTPAREAAAKARMSECGGFDAWREAMQRAAKSRFLTGKATGTSPASFDWLHKPSNFARLMEGNYDDRYSASRPVSEGRPHRADPALEQIARLAGLGQA